MQLCGVFKDKVVEIDHLTVCPRNLRLNIYCALFLRIWGGKVLLWILSLSIQTPIPKATPCGSYLSARICSALKFHFHIASLLAGKNKIRHLIL